MRRSNLTTLAYLLLVFVSGAVLGAFASRLYTLKATVNAARPDFRRQYLEQMRSRLHLTPQQVTQLEQIMETTHQRMREARKTIDDEHARQVSAMLDDSQKAEYAKLRTEHEQHRRHGDKGQ
jgi:Spy/CpxP family protein refolding chaperone